MTMPVDQTTRIDRSSVTKVRVCFVGGNSLTMIVPKEVLKETCDRLADGIIKNGLVQKDAETGFSKIEAFEGFFEGRGSQRICLFWFHHVTGFVLEDADTEQELYKMQLEMTKIQLELMKKSKRDADKDDGWQA